MEQKLQALLPVAQCTLTHL